MDDTKQPPEAGAHALQGPHWHRAAGSEEPAFTPMRLVLQPGGQALEMARPDILIGRHTDADVRLPLPDVSRRHCRCYFADGIWRVSDLNSLNGVYVNGERVPQAELHHGDKMVIGGFTFEVDLHGEQVRPAGEGVLKSIADALAENSPERRLAS